MSWEQFGLAASFIVVMTITPGPANLSLLSAGATVGFARSLPYLVGIWAGGALVISAAAFGLGSLLLAMPTLVSTLKIIGFAYICWLAIKLARNGFATEGRKIAPSFASGLALHPVNPKAYVMNVMTFTAFILPQDDYAPQAALLATLTFLTMTIATSAWGMFGELLQRLIKAPWAMRTISVAASASMVASIGLAFFL